MDRRRRARPQRVLVVDDEADVRHVWREWLTMWHFHVDEAENGSVALLKAQQHPPDLVIMDVTMPVLDGFGATARLKSNPLTAQIPVLLLSADVSKSAPERARRAGGDVFLSKPIRPQDLLAEIRQVFRRANAEERRGNSTALP
jgi:CheY-like chemotaxis protein